MKKMGLGRKLMFGGAIIVIHTDAGGQCIPDSEKHFDFE